MDTATPLQHTPHRPRASGLRRAPSVATAAACATLAWGAFTAGAFTTSALAQTQAPGQPRSPAQSVRPIDLGKGEFESRCASCHGMGGRGDGPMKPFLTVAPSDLTTIAKRNGGAFPEQLVWEMIDGRSSISIGPHGSREMPVWGQEFRDQAKRRGDQNPEWSTRNRIVALLAYLNGMQQK